MRKIWWILIASFFVGILVCGLGVGIAFAEFSGLTYAGEEEIGEMVQETLVYEIATEAEHYNVYTNFYIEPGQKIISDNSIPKDQIEIDVTYNGETDEPFLYDHYYYQPEYTYVQQIDEYGNEVYVENIENTDSGKLVCDINVSYNYDGFQVFMEHKDEMLTDLKNNRIGSYRIKDDGYDVIVRCNPAIADKILVQ